MRINSITGRFIYAAKYNDTKKPVEFKQKKHDNFQEKLKDFRKQNHAPQVDTFTKTETMIAPTADMVTGDEEGEIKLYTPFSGDILNMTAEDALRSFEAKMSKISNFSIQNGNEMRKTMDDLASNYAVYKRHLVKYGTEKQIKKFEAVFEKTVDRYSKSYADEVGGFFENGGMAGEKERMYEAVKDRIYTLANSYDEFISNFGEIMNGIISESEDGVFGIVEGVQSAYKENGDMELVTPNASGKYTRDALSAAVDLIAYTDKMMARGKASTQSEEEQGGKLGTLAVEALSFLKTSAAISEHKEIFLNIVGERIEQIVNESDKLLEKSADQSVVKGAFSQLDRDAVYSIIQKMMDCFNQTKSITDAVVGKKIGLWSYLEKQDANVNIIRYQYSDYWEKIQQKSEQQRKQQIGAI